MKLFLTGFQILISILLIATIMFQSRGSQMGMTFGGAGETYRSKRGVEKLLFYITIILAFLFGISSILLLMSK